MQPDSGKLLRFSAEVNLCLKEVSNCDIIEFDADRGYSLLYCDEFLNIQQVIRLCYRKAANFVVRLITEVGELGPGSRVESQDKSVLFLR
jgi:hypothetical protein